MGILLDPPQLLSGTQNPKHSCQNYRLIFSVERFWLNNAPIFFWFAVQPKNVNGGLIFFPVIGGLALQQKNGGFWQKNDQKQCSFLGGKSGM